MKSTQPANKITCGIRIYPDGRRHSGTVFEATIAQTRRCGGTVRSDRQDAGPWMCDACIEALQEIAGRIPASFVPMVADVLRVMREHGVGQDEAAAMLGGDTMSGNTQPRPRLSESLTDTADGFDADADECIRDGDPESAERSQRMAGWLRRIAYNHRTAAAYQGDDSLDPEQVT